MQQERQTYLPETVVNSKKRRDRVFALLNEWAGQTSRTGLRDRVSRFVDSAEASAWDTPYVVNEQGEFGGKYPPLEDVLEKFELLFGPTTFQNQKHLLMTEIKGVAVLSVKGEVFFEVMNRLLTFDILPVNTGVVVVGKGLADILNEKIAEVKNDLKKNGQDVPFFLCQDVTEFNADPNLYPDPKKIFDQLPDQSKELFDLLEQIRTELQDSLTFASYFLVREILNAEDNVPPSKGKWITRTLATERQIWRRFLHSFLAAAEEFLDTATVVNLDQPINSNDEREFVKKAAQLLQTKFPLPL